MVLAELISSRLKFWSIWSRLQPPNLEYPSSLGFSIPVRVLSGALRLSRKWNPNVRGEKWWVEASTALLVFLLVIRLSPDRPGVWRRWGLRGYNIGCLDTPGAPHSWDYLGKLKLFLLVLPTLVFICLSLSLPQTVPTPTPTPTHCFFPRLYFTPVISEVNARLSGWPSGWTPEQKEG